MENGFVAWRLLLLASLFIFPQLLGILLYWRLTWLPKWIGRVVGVLIPALSFFFLAPYFFFAGIREEALRGEVVACGNAAMAGAFLLLLGTGLHLVIALVVQVVLAKRR